jgi:hypothetical protein
MNARNLLAVAIFGLLASSLLAQHSGSHSRSSTSVSDSSKTVYVSGYTRSDGTYVAPYYRRAPGTAGDGSGSGGGAADVGSDHADLTEWAAKHRSRAPVVTPAKTSGRSAEEPSSVSTASGSGNYIAWSRPVGVATPGPMPRSVHSSSATTTRRKPTPHP